MESTRGKHPLTGFALVIALLAGYALGTMRAPAQADDSSRIVDLLRDISRSEASQADALKTIARSAEKCAR